jgi:hypothetical protein
LKCIEKKDKGEIVLPSEMTLRYLEAERREGDNFNPERWLEQIRAEKASQQVESPPPVTAKEVGPKTTLCDRADNAVSGLTYHFIRRRTLKEVTKSSAGKELVDLSLRVAMAKIFAAWDKFLRTKSRDSIYPYLKAVYAVVRRAKKERRTGKLLRYVTRKAGLHYDRDVDPFATIIRSSSAHQLDAKMISKLARALRYAAFRKWPPGVLKSSIKRLGGINAAADRYAKNLGRKAKQIAE